jgi:hypothetical protein
MPHFTYECDKENKGCGHRFKGRKTFESRYNVECPLCEQWGGRTDRHGKRAIKIVQMDAETKKRILKEALGDAA